MQSISPEFTVRSATLEDVPTLVDIDMAMFNPVYSEYSLDDVSLRNDLEKKFKHRMELLGGEWTSVLERRGVPMGLITSCPTSKTPESFSSWEETTDNGTLDGTYDKEGENVYIVTLSVLPEASKAKVMLFAHQLGHGLKAGYKRAFFESRMPGFRSWLESGQGAGFKPSDLSDDQLQAQAEIYFRLQDNLEGEDVPYDPLLRLYKGLGCNLVRLVNDAYADEPSLNYGVLCTYDAGEQLEAFLPKKVAHSKAARWLVGSLVSTVSHSEQLAEKIF